MQFGILSEFKIFDAVNEKSFVIYVIIGQI